jgi:hypothetical protein
MFSVESFIFDNKQKKFIRQSNPYRVIGLITSDLFASYCNFDDEITITKIYLQEKHL